MEKGNRCRRPQLLYTTLEHLHQSYLVWTTTYSPLQSCKSDRYDRKWTLNVENRSSSCMNCPWRTNKHTDKKRMSMSCAASHRHVFCDQPWERRTRASTGQLDPGKHASQPCTDQGLVARSWGRESGCVHVSNESWPLRRPRMNGSGRKTLQILPEEALMQERGLFKGPWSFGVWLCCALWLLVLWSQERWTHIMIVDGDSMSKMWGSVWWAGLV